MAICHLVLIVSLCSILFPLPLNNKCLHNTSNNRDVDNCILHVFILSRVLEILSSPLHPLRPLFLTVWCSCPFPTLRALSGMSIAAAGLLYRHRQWTTDADGALVLVFGICVLQGTRVSADMQRLENTLGARRVAQPARVLRARGGIRGCRSRPSFPD